MTSPGHEYTLVGFSEFVDRRPLVFVEALPAGKVCSACGLVPKVLGVLPCGHFFCKPCYEQCLHRGGVVCPLDGNACPEDEVNCVNYSAESVLAKKVLCWNHRNGCNVVMTAAEISRHFHHGCGHHSAKCPKCSTEILASDVYRHLESRCDAAREPDAATLQPRTVPQESESLGATWFAISDGFRRIHNADSIAMSSIQAELEEISRNLKTDGRTTTSGQGEANARSLETRQLQESIDQLRIQTANLKDELHEFMRVVCGNQQALHSSFVEKHEAFKKSLTDAVPPGTDLATQFVAIMAAIGDVQRETNAEFHRLSLTMNRQYDQMSERLRSADVSPETWKQNYAQTAEVQAESWTQDASKIPWAKNISPEDRRYALALLTSIMPVATTHTWTFEACESLKQRARSEHFVKRMDEPVYLRGYCVSVGIGVFSSGEVYFLFQLHNQELNRYLEWPFNLQIRLSIHHPEGNQKLEYCVTPSRSCFCKDYFLRPKGGINGWFPVCRLNFTTAELEFRGFIKDGRMLLSLSLEHPSADDEP